MSAAKAELAKVNRDAYAEWQKAVKSCEDRSTTAFKFNDPKAKNEALAYFLMGFESARLGDEYWDE